MRRAHTLSLGILLGLLCMIFSLSSRAQAPRVKREPTLLDRITEATKLSDEDANKFLRAFGPAIREELRRGKEVAIAGLGTFRVVRVAEHRDLVNGRPAVIPASNVVEFLAEENVTDAANSPGAAPEETVPGFKYIPIPGQTPSQKVPNIRNPGVRTK